MHSDVSGRLEAKSLSGAEYFVTFIDDKSRYVWIYILKNKSEVFKKFLEWKYMVEKSSGEKIKTFRSDNGGEYTSKEFEDYLKKNSIRHECTVPKTPEQNGVAERMNRTLVETVRAMLSDSKLPKKFGAEALSIASYVRNRSPTTAVKAMTPYGKTTNQMLIIYTFLDVVLMLIYQRMKDLKWTTSIYSRSLEKISNGKLQTYCNTN